MTWRFRSILVVGALALVSAGCDGVLGNRPMAYPRNDRLATELKVNPRLRPVVARAVGEVFGPTPLQIKVPAGSGLPGGGVRLARTFYVNQKPYHTRDPEKGPRQTIEGGYALYRRHCLHCHGLSGGGDGPTADFLFPRPRDYRLGVFKFTSTPYGLKPTRADLRKTIQNGLPGTSMPAFEAQMSAGEIEQVLDYVIFLSMRGETERLLLGEASSAAEESQVLTAAEVKQITDESLSVPTARELAQGVFEQWKSAEANVVNPPIPRPLVGMEESIHRGQMLFRGLTEQKLECTGCHGPQAKGDGKSFIDEETFYDVVFREKDPTRFDRANLLGLLSAKGGGTEDHFVPAKELPRTMVSTSGRVAFVSVSEMLKQLEADGSVVQRIRAGSPVYKVAIGPEKLSKIQQEYDLWKNSLNDWGEPLRPANLNRGTFTTYKGGRRPIDIYWRIYKGINNSKMPAHDRLEPGEVWDLVNFVLALPYRPELLPNTGPPAPGPTATVAQRGGK